MFNMEEHNRSLDEGEASLTKEKPSNIVEIFMQPIFGNPLILNKNGTPLGLGGSRDRSAFVRAGCSRTQDL